MLNLTWVFLSAENTPITISWLEAIGLWACYFCSCGDKLLPI
jgi:hypothetical protein